MSIQHMRQTYTMAGLSKQDVDPDPMVQFNQWFEQAKSDDLPPWFEVNAMTLSTSSPAGHVTSRIVLLKGVTDGHFVFFSNYDSIKGKQIDANSRVGLCFYWPHLERQVRIEGTVSKTSREVSEQYFHSRPRESQLGANVSDQSSVIPDEDHLPNRMKELESQYADRQVPCPSHWGGYQVEPEMIEFWQGRPSRLHDRIVYRQADSDWQIVRLSP